jgi:LysR family transcriptional regulator, regulator for genes of the gallate degradation pathway
MPFVRFGSGRSAGACLESVLPEKFASLRQLKLFEAVGRLGNVTRAARECGLSQPAASQAIMVLEGIVGIGLLEGRATGSALTTRGGEFHGSITRVMQRLESTLRYHGIGDTDRVIWQLSINALRMLGAIRERGSLENAAASLGIPRQSLLRNMRVIEQHLGCTILVRDGGSMLLNGSGISLARQFGLIVQEVEWLFRDVRDAAQRDNETIVIGVDPDPGTSSLGMVVKNHLARNPSSCIEVIEAAQDDLLARLVIGELDIVVGHVHEPMRPDVAWHLLTTATFRIVARKGHPLAKQRIVPLRDLAAQPWALGGRGSQRRAATDILFAERQQPVCILVTSAAPMMAQIMADSDTLGLMTEYELANRSDTLAVIDLEATNVSLEIGWACRMGWKPSAMHGEIIAALQVRFAGSAQQAG